jgi:ABC-type glutathione transport system ATPase component
VALLEVKSLFKNFVLKRNLFGKATKVLHAVRGVSFEINAGECLCIVGESGCGKSTMARLITRLIEPDSGLVNFGGVDFLKLRGNNLRKSRSNIQMIFQNPFSSLDPKFKIFDSIAEPMHVHRSQWQSDKAIKERVYELLDLVELDPSIADKYPHECSGGQNQRVAIARALINDPLIIMGDEPTGNLDKKNSDIVFSIFKELAENYNQTLLIVTHDQEFAQNTHRTIVMEDGKVIS